MAAVGYRDGKNRTQEIKIARAPFLERNGERFKRSPAEFSYGIFFGVFAKLFLVRMALTQLPSCFFNPTMESGEEEKVEGGGVASLDILQRHLRRTRANTCEKED